MSTFTTPPSAFPTGSTSDLCAFVDRNDLINQVSNNWQGYNVSLLVQTCPGVCVLVFGAGNPDICGIGVKQIDTPVSYRMNI